MSQKDKKLTLHNFQQTHQKNKEQKLLQQALVYLKLRQHGCPKSRALIFAKKYLKQKVIDGTIRKDGPAGFRKLYPQKPQGQLINGWLKGQKLKYSGLRGFSQQIIKNVSKQKQIITKYNKVQREKFEELRRKQKQPSNLQYSPEQSKKFMQQITVMKDQFLKDRQKRNLFLSYQGIRLEQYTKNYFQKIGEQDPNSYIVKFAAFQNPISDQRFKIETDWQIAKGKSLNTYQIQGQAKRKTVLDFRKSLTNLRPPKQIETEKTNKFRATLHNSNKRLMMGSLTRLPKWKNNQLQKQMNQFNDDIDKLYWIKTKRCESQLLQHNQLQ